MRPGALATRSAMLPTLGSANNATLPRRSSLPAQTSRTSVVRQPGLCQPQRPRGRSFRCRFVGRSARSSPIASVAAAAAQRRERARSDSVPALRPRQRAHADRARGPQGADRRRQRLVPRRLEERAAREDRLRAPVRAPDVPGQRALERRVLQGLRSRGRDGDQRDDGLRSHELLPERAELRARRGALDGVRSHGAPARRDRSGAARRAARRGQEREASGRRPALRQRLPRARRERVSRRTPVLVGADRVDGGSRRGDARRRARVVPHLVRRGERAWSWSRATSTPTSYSRR